MTTPTAAPGWYPCPATPDTLRYYDGSTWTTHTALAPSSTPVPVAAPPLPVAAPSPVGPYAGAYGAPYGAATSYAAQGYQPLAPESGSSGPGSAMHWIVPVGRSGVSIAAGYVGLLALVIWPLAPVAIGLGIWGLRKARSGGHGSGRCIFAIIAGVIGCLLGVLFLAGGMATGG